LANRLAGLGLLIAVINGAPAEEHVLAQFLVHAGFSPSAMGFHVRRGVSLIPPLKAGTARQRNA
jgi:hypothetical protein